MADAFDISILSLGGGGNLGLCRLPGRYGELQKDIATIVVWRPDLVVSMTEKVEMAELGAAALPELLSQQGIAWRHFPVPDFGIPEAKIGSEWPSLSKEIHQLLNAKKKVLLHCRGGIGRSGMIALRLMIELGEKPDEALQRLRSVRAGAVETDGQLAWAKGQF